MTAGNGQAPTTPDARPAPTRDKKPAATKQFVELRGVPVVVHTLRQFAANPEISEIFVALRKSESRKG